MRAMRSYDELVASENVFDWTPQELRKFCQETYRDMQISTRSYARSTLANKFFEMRQEPLEALYEKSRNELQSIVEQADQAVADALNGVYDDEQK